MWSTCYIPFATHAPLKELITLSEEAVTGILTGVKLNFAVNCEKHELMCLTHVTLSRVGMKLTKQDGILCDSNTV